MGIRLVVIDDNPHVSWEDRVHPVNATFHRFLAGFLDLPGTPVASIAHCVPVRAATSAPATLPLDPRLEVVGTAPFHGIEGYLRHAPALLRRNHRILRPVIASGDLVWIKLPASNGPLAGWLAWRSGVPRFGYVAGSALAVARGRGLGLPAQAIGLAYDVAGRLAGGRERTVVGSGLVDDGGIVTSLVEPEEIRDRATSPWPTIAGRLRLTWAGRLADGKGLEVLLDAFGSLVSSADPGQAMELAIVGDGPALAALQARAAALGIDDRVEWLGYLADRTAYLDALSTGDLFVFPSPAEGFPKVILDAMAVGLPVLAAPVGPLGQLRGGQMAAVVPDDPVALADSIRRLVATPDRAKELRTAGRDLAAVHTRPAESARLVARWQATHPDLPWD